MNKKTKTKQSKTKQNDVWKVTFIDFYRFFSIATVLVLMDKAHKNCHDWKMTTNSLNKWIFATNTARRVCVCLWALQALWIMRIYILNNFYSHFNIYSHYESYFCFLGWSSSNRTNLSLFSLNNTYVIYSVM